VLTFRVCCHSDYLHHALLSAVVYDTALPRGLQDAVQTQGLLPKSTAYWSGAVPITMTSEPIALLYFALGLGYKCHFALGLAQKCHTQCTLWTLRP
jgi:hypothetical protein